MRRRTAADIIAGGQIVHIAPEASVYEACELMRERAVGALLVMEHGDLLGILSQRDIVEGVVIPRADPDKTEVRTLMTSEVHSVPPETTAVEALRLLHDTGVHHLPVVGKNGEVHGMVSLSDFLAPELASAEQEAAAAMQVYESPNA
jgi:CBS domain-containing protein